MKLERFLAEREDRWAELGAASRRAKGRPERLGSEGVLRLGELYRSTAADLALARRAWPGDPVVRRLETLVAEGRQLVYDSTGRRGSLKAFFGRTYWQSIMERPGPLILAWALLIVGGALGALWAARDPAAASGLVPGKFSGAVTPSGGDLGISGAEQAALATQIFTNNIQVSFLAFAAGILFGLGTGFVLLQNGLILGVVGAIAAQNGAGSPFVELVVAHGVLELSCIAVTAAAGMRMGWALVDPGRLKRTQALGQEAARSVRLVLGTIPWLILAGLVEGFVTPAGLGLGLNLALGVLLGSVYWGLVLGRGRAAKGDPSPSLAGTQLRTQH
jgi:uncharacterized membrane protein SpoIIM required for sporulation